MYIGKVLKLIKEYNNSKTNTTLAAKGGEKASGKNYDNMITGKSTPYKNNEYNTQYSKKYPELGKLVKRFKAQSIKGNIIINGKALIELNDLMSNKSLPQSDDGTISIPFGDNVKVKQIGAAIFLVGDNDIDNIVTTNDITG